ncbi:Gp19/Gp15/Gp42 family protein [Nocardia puris]|uniref:Gp19/Gp15/Gp42-like protein n=1 Tax=Nocardia puris TaxID=208602 RepID=A0A366DBZ5_9NOCA|nr:Gp19/Gp15/Gp42 family protein [Nocardia puris]RBO87029.1 Gp19/Gp15/Gp42-like protein [Nocardia puris]
MFATRDDVRGHFEGVIPTSRNAWLDAKITAASTLLISLVPSMATTTDPVRLDRARDMVCEAVLRVYRNPAGAQQESASVYSVTRSRAAGSGQLYFEESELDALRGHGKRRKFGTIPTAPWRVDVFGR